jgi:hypothetical protein
MNIPTKSDARGIEDEYNKIQRILAEDISRLDKVADTLENMKRVLKEQGEYYSEIRKRMEDAKRNELRKSI